ncbi:hypothetical protein M9H77_03669 [Catharanthus roseus]|uniref:Uncharacterized protein n=1 Tax=Catharanthus roseus TaxID=4058 RepID=A0ACC0CBY9_CATRO|nr:hypothetical protein M9H77_03669 [Catharanthus roseus]
MEGMEITPNLFEDISWGPLLTINEFYYPEMIYEFYYNLHKERVQKQGNIPYQWVTSRVGGRDISFDDRILYTLLGTPENGIRFYTKNKNALIPTYRLLRPPLPNDFPYGCFLTKVLQYLVLNLVGVGDHIGIRKIYNKHTFKRMGFSRNEEGMLVRGGQGDSEESDEDDEEMRGKKL